MAAMLNRTGLRLGCDGPGTRLSRLNLLPALGTVCSRNDVTRAKSAVASSRGGGEEHGEVPTVAAAAGTACRRGSALTTWELLRSWAVLKLCASERLTSNAEKLMHAGRKVIGDVLFKAVVRPTFYDQFVGGESPEQLESTVVRLNEAGVRLMLAVMLESDVDDAESDSKLEDVLEYNLNIYLDIIPKIAVMGDKRRPMCQLKGSGLVRSDLLAKISNLAGSNMDASQLVDEIYQILKDPKADCPNLTSHLTRRESELFSIGLKRMKDVVDSCVRNNVTCVMDAEGTWLNPALTAMALAFMKMHNATEPWVYHTYQCYLKDGYPSLKAHAEWASQLGIHFGTKVVRGAYLEKERAMAKAMGVDCPLADSYEATNKNYDSAIAYILNRIGSGDDKISVVVASHNENSVAKAKELLVQRVRGNPSAFNPESVVFAQLYGMGNFVTNMLSSDDLPVYKSVPYGNLFEVLPYLARRAQENAFVLRGARADGERQYLWKEFSSRLRRHQQ